MKSPLQFAKDGTPLSPSATTSSKEGPRKGSIRLSFQNQSRPPLNYGEKVTLALSAIGSQEGSEATGGTGGDTKEEIKVPVEDGKDGKGESPKAGTRGKNAGDLADVGYFDADTGALTPTPFVAENPEASTSAAPTSLR